MAFEAKLIGADRHARRFTIAAVRLPHDTTEAMKEIGEVAELVFAAHAPHRSGRLARGIKAHGGGGGIIVTAHAENPDSGYDYVGVTRFGHHAARLYPKRSKALKTPFGFFRSVKGYHPAGDWAERALPQIEQQAQHIATKLGRKVVASL